MEIFVKIFRLLGARYIVVVYRKEDFSWLLKQGDA